MIGITSYGAYIPIYRLSRDIIAVGEGFIKRGKECGQQR